VYLKSWELVHWRPKGGPIISAAVTAELQCPVCHLERGLTIEGDALSGADGVISWIVDILGQDKTDCAGCGVTSVLPAGDKGTLEQEARARITDDWLISAKERLAPSPFSGR